MTGGSNNCKSPTDENYEGNWEKTVLSHQKSIQYQIFWNLMRFGFHLAFTKQVVGLTVHFN